MEAEKVAIEYLRENEFEKNEHGVYIYQNTRGNHIINLASILADYQQWLIDNKIVTNNIK